MQNRFSFRLFAVTLLTLSFAGTSFAGEWKSLFDGKTLKGWTQKNGTATYEVVNCTIVGTTKEGSPNSFLCSDKEYGDFELKFEVKVHDKLNSGVQIRSQTKAPGKGQKYGRVNGPQCEIESTDADGEESGYIYGEATGRGWLVPDDKRTPHKHFKNGQWNKFRVIAKGNRFQTWINGHKIIDLTDEEIYKTHPKGFIGLQVHGIKKGDGPYDVAWRDICIKTLN